jgi:hypothetical protein
MSWLARWRCRNGHEWFPGNPAMEFLPIPEACLRCPAKRYLMPWGTCLGEATGPYEGQGVGWKHSLAQHYTVTDENELQEHSFAGCPGPQ